MGGLDNAQPRLRAIQGIYTGDGAGARQIVIGFVACLVVIQCTAAGATYRVVLVSQNSIYNIWDDFGANNTNPGNTDLRADDGFDCAVADGSNNAGRVYHYTAIEVS